MSFLTNKPFGIVYNFPVEYNPIAAELWRRDIPITLVNPSHLVLDPADTDIRYSLLLNDLGTPAGFQPQSEFVQSLIQYNRHLEISSFKFSQGRIINGAQALEIFTSRARQISLFASLGLKYPRTIIANNVETLISQLPTLQFPVLIKESNLAKTNSVLKFDDAASLVDAVFDGRLVINNEFVLAQEYRDVKSDHIVRVDTLNGKFLAAQKVFTLREPSLSWEVELRAEPIEPSTQIIQAVEQVVRAGKVDFGSVEYFTDRKTNETFFYNITPFSYRRSSDPQGKIVTDIGDYIEKRLQKIREFELAL
jgi:hypothetical protein